MYSADILLDSLSPAGSRLTTWKLTYPRFVHAELMTHRAFSRNSASSRAIPTEKFIAQVEVDPALPIWWGKNQAGMQAKEELSGPEQTYVKKLWLEARDNAVRTAKQMSACGLHKQLVNRVLESWMFITVIVSATDYANFFHLRCHPDAQPEIRWVAETMAALYRQHEPTPVPEGAWHTPLMGFAGDELLNQYDRIRVSVGRCARVSYLTHEGIRDVQADIELHDRLKAGSGGVGHWSPFEHVAQARADHYYSGNFHGWLQYRKSFSGENRTAFPWES